MTVLLYAALLLTLVAAVGTTLSLRQPSGPEGPVGSWMLALLACLSLATALAAAAIDGRLPGFAGAVPVYLLTAVGLLIAFGAVLMGTPDSTRDGPQTLLIAAPYVLLLACATIAHPELHAHASAVYWTSAVLLAGAGAFGWGLCLHGLAHHMRQQAERLDRQASAQREQEAQRRQAELTAFEELAEDAPVSVLLPLAFAREPHIRQQSRGRLAACPSLHEDLAALLDRDCEQAVGYVARVWEAPSPELAPAFGRMLERQLKTWRSLQHDQHAGTWETNLRGYFEGAERIQHAGGDLHPQLRAWHELLSKCRGLGGLRAFVGTLLQPEPDPART